MTLLLIYYLIGLAVMTLYAYLGLNDINKVISRQFSDTRNERVAAAFIAMILPWVWIIDVAINAYRYFVLKTPWREL